MLWEACSAYSNGCCATKTCFLSTPPFLSLMQCSLPYQLSWHLSFNVLFQRKIIAFGLRSFLQLWVKISKDSRSCQLSAKVNRAGARVNRIWKTKFCWTLFVMRRYGPADIKSVHTLWKCTWKGTEPECHKVGLAGLPALKWLGKVHALTVFFPSWKNALICIPREENTPFCPALISIYSQCPLCHLTTSPTYIVPALPRLTSQRHKCFGKERGWGRTVQGQNHQSNHCFLTHSALPGWELHARWTGYAVPGSHILCHQQESNGWVFQPFSNVHLHPLPRYVYIISRKHRCSALQEDSYTVLFLLLFSFVLNIAPFPGCSGISVSDEETSQFYICNDILGLEFTIILSLRSWKNSC